jgi:tetratricopeptide (TPR) repeat protein
MKHYHFLILFLFCQTASAKDFTCNYYNSNTIYGNIKSTIDIDPTIEGYVSLITKQVGLERNFILIKANNISNCYATNINGIRVIVYDNAFIQNLTSTNNTKWVYLSILAHEIGHHLQGHTLLNPQSYKEMRDFELEADKFSGFIMQRLGATVEQSISAINKLDAIPLSQINTSTHPGKSSRIEVVKKGYYEASQYKKDIEANSIEYIKSLKSNIEKLQNEKIHPEYYYNQGIDAFKLGNWDKAIDLFTTSINLSGADIFTLAMRADCFINLKNNRAALKDYAILDSILNSDSKSNNEALKLFATDYLYFNRGLCYETIGDYNSAINDFEKVININPNDSGCLYKLCILYTKTNAYDKAFLSFDRLLSKNIETSGFEKFSIGNLYLYRGIAKYESKKYNPKTALVDLNKSLTIFPVNYPDRYLAYYYIGQIYAFENLKDSISYPCDSAIYFLKKFTYNKKYVNYPQFISNAHFLLGWVYQRYMTNESYLSSIEHLSISIENTPNNPMPVYSRAKSYYFLKMMYKYCQDLQTACELNFQLACNEMTMFCK